VGQFLGRIFVQGAFPPESKKGVLTMLSQIRTAFNQTVQSEDWMDAPTKALSLQKLALVGQRIGYPDVWDDISSLHDEGSLYQNYLNAEDLFSRQAYWRMGLPRDDNEWEMNPQTVNAYYEPTTNQINFPAGILMPPFYDVTLPPPANLGAIGMVMGHELTHGFDSSGRLYDGVGNLDPWWSSAVVANWNMATQCVVAAYNSINGNGQLQLNENLADMGGVKLAHAVLMQALQNQSDLNGQISSVFGRSAEQVFFIAYAQTWCTVQTQQAAYNQNRTNVHSLAPIRVKGPLMQFPPFAKAFSCPAGSPMVSSFKCDVW